MVTLILTDAEAVSLHDLLALIGMKRAQFHPIVYTDEDEETREFVIERIEEAL